MRHIVIAIVGAAVLLGCRSNKDNQGEPAKTEPVAVEPSVPATVTMAWCAQLRQRLHDRYLPQARAKYPNRGSDFIEQVVGDYCKNLEYNCQQDVGKPTDGKWRCHWDSDFDNYDDCNATKPEPAPTQSTSAAPPASSSPPKGVGDLATAKRQAVDWAKGYYANFGGDTTGIENDVICETAGSKFKCDVITGSSSIVLSCPGTPGGECRPLM